jgi:ABC-type uncharacterized transport system substrate-binding protein
LVNKLVAKRLELLSELAPGTAALGMLIDPNNPNAQADTKDAEAAAAALGRKLVIAKASAESEFDAAFAALVQRRVSALLVGAHVLFFTRREQLVTLAARHAVAASYATREFVAAGGLMSYGPNQTDVYRLVGVYVFAMFISPLQAHEEKDITVTQLLSSTMTSSGQPIILPHKDAQIVVSIHVQLDQVEARHAVVAAADRFAVDDACAAAR